jgi:hypothetical protein
MWKVITQVASFFQNQADMNCISAVYFISKVTRVMQTHSQAPVTPTERQTERNQKVPRHPSSFPRLPQILLVSPLVSQRGSYEGIKTDMSLFSSMLQYVILKE